MADANPEPERRPIRWQQVALGVGLIVVVDSAAAWVIWPPHLPRPAVAKMLPVNIPEIERPPVGPETAPPPRELPVVEKMLEPREVFEAAGPEALAALRERLSKLEIAAPPVRADAELRDLLLRVPEAGLDPSRSEERRVGKECRL